jgi:hypothetical protein
MGNFNGILGAGKHPDNLFTRAQISPLHETRGGIHERFLAA